MKRILFVILLSTSGFAYAEHGCQDGYIPVYQGGQQVCVADYNLPSWSDQGSGPAVPQPPAPDFYAVYATDPAHGKLFWSTFYRSTSEAESVAIEACSKATGQACKSLGWFSNQCGALALNQEKQVFSGYDKDRRGAGREAMKACNKESSTSICRLWLPPVCTGAQFDGTANDHAATASNIEIEALSAELDRREYWGAVAASDSGEVVAKANRPSRKSAERAVIDESGCKGCTVRLTYRDSCAGVAWPSDGRPLLETLLNNDPQKAEAGARGQCTTKYGSCVGTTRCSGRRYRDGYPSGSPKFQKNGTWVDAP